MCPATGKRLSVEELRSIVAPLAEKYGVDKVYLFGSVARGDHNENSDYDFCIELGKIRSISVFSEFFQDLRDAVKCDIDLVDTKSVGSEFLSKIMTEGVIVYG
ncbi:MAG: nucleotidyltransferase domain-containing protein [Methanomassiliicoccaceae archaeon]|nr:nucleotidyltransferase domain-containing protein [Methanomassiliicoccaceae archaeon]